jgi:uncharacterized membrane protein
MLGYLFRSATYYIIWQKFQKQIILVVISAVMISIIFGIYEDLFKVLRMNHKDSLLLFFLVKWMSVGIIIAYNIHKLKQVKEEDTKSVQEAIINNEKRLYPEKSQRVLRKKEKLISTTDLILERYRTTKS